MTVQKSIARAPGESLRSFALPQIMDAAAAADLKTALVGLIDGGTRLHIDAEKVERITTPCVQTLLAASKTLRGRGGRLVLRRPSPAMASAFRDLGLNDELDAWMDDDA